MNNINNNNINKKFEEDARIYEYTSAANPKMSFIPVMTYLADSYQSGETRIIYFDNKESLDTSYKATSPNLLASFIRICKGEKIGVKSMGTSNVFYVIKGCGNTVFEKDTIHWKTGDLFVVPYSNYDIVLEAVEEDSILYWINDEPLLYYLGAKPLLQKFRPTYFAKDRMLLEIDEIRNNNDWTMLNRLGILLGNRLTEDTTKTLTHTMWSLLNVLPAKSIQKPHRHNSVALDLCISSKCSEFESVYTLMGEEIDEEGNIVNPIRCDWIPGSVFITPPGWWHSHHNDSSVDAYVLPVQDAGLYTYQRTLDIRFFS